MFIVSFVYGIQDIFSDLLGASKDSENEHNENSPYFFSYVIDNILQYTMLGFLFYIIDTYYPGKDFYLESSHILPVTIPRDL